MRLRTEVVNHRGGVVQVLANFADQVGSEEKTEKEKVKSQVSPRNAPPTL
jgi:hypothetical protein